jgi:hypothetical protein
MGNSSLGAVGFAGGKVTDGEAAASMHHPERKWRAVDSTHTQKSNVTA